MTAASQANPLVSVVIPVYGTEKWLPRCLDSVIHQTYKNLEIIVVNDCSPGNCEDIVKKYQSKDSRIKYLEHEQNKGLFQARITGAQKASGQYLAFVDSDDYIAVDYYRLLVKAATEHEADIVCANMVMVNESDGRHYINVLNRPSGKVLHNDEIFKAYFGQEGLAFHWHAVWNKIYSRQLWDKAFPHYLGINRHLIMAEDFVYSTVLFYYAKKYVSIDYEGYYYFQNINASTSLSGNVGKYLKNITDLGTAFDFVYGFLKETNKLAEYGDKFNAWKDRYSRFWMDNIKNSNLSVRDKEVAFQKLKEVFRIDSGKYSFSSDHYFYSTSVDWDNRFEKLKNEIVNSQYKYISFDIFDTLIVRPFMDAHDLFYFLDFHYEELTNDKVGKFSKLRTEAEALLRKELSDKREKFEEITLDEIYECLVKKFGIDPEVADTLKTKEVELELRFCEPRKSAKELFDLAHHVGKKIIIVSDMYLPKEVIEKILHGNEYTDYFKLYLSSELRLSKHYGGLYKYIISDLGCDPNQILHIGDNWETDILIAQKFGLKTFHYPKAISRLFNHIPDKHSGNSTLLYFHPRGKWINYQYAKDYMLIRCMLALVANRYFDNPFRTFSGYSDFNCDPLFVGYYALGMHVFAIAKWMLEDAVQKGYKKIHFIARDGYIVKLIYDKLSQCYLDAPKSNYLYASRKSIIPALIHDMNLLHSMDNLINIKAFTPRKFLELILKTEANEELTRLLEKSGIMLDSKFEDTLHYQRFVSVLKNSNFDLTSLKKYRETVKQYLYQEVGEEEAIFDIGYSGTTQMVMATLGLKADAYYIHVNNDAAFMNSKRFDYDVKVFYSYSPSISGTLREYIFSETGPSCIGYQKLDNRVVPVFEEDRFTYIEHFIMDTMHEAAEEFAEDLIERFKDYIPRFTIRNEDVSMPFEMFLHSAKDHDRKLFAECYFEDEVYHGKSKINLLNEWNQASGYHMTGQPIETIPGRGMGAFNFPFLENRNKYSKALFYFLYRRDIFKEKIKAKFAHRPRFLWLMKNTYKNLRLIKNLLYKVIR